MARHNEIGKIGEQIAKDYCLENGYEFLEQNWRYGRAEIDLIIKDGPILVFVEVKTRSSIHFGQPEEFVTTTKEQLITGAATAYMDQIGHEWEIRFDVIAIHFRNEQSYSLKHIEDAFFPGLE